MVKRNRRISWKRLLGESGPSFLGWLEENYIRLRLYNTLAEVLKYYLEQNLKPNLSSPCLSRDFVDMLLQIHDKKKCADEKTFHTALAIQAYTYAHLLERYRRIWDVLLILLKAKVLPMSDDGIDVLDIGTGPAPALYAVSDFYSALRDFATKKGYAFLDTPSPRLHCIESSPYMWQFFHIFSELSGRPGPFQPTFEKFEGVDFAESRAYEKWARIETEIREQDTSEEYARWFVNQMFSPGYLYNLVIFSYFLTTEDNVVGREKELLSVFSSLRPGGVVVIVGGTSDEFPTIHNFVHELAIGANLLKVSGVQEVVPCNYFEPYNSYGKRLKELYDTIWNWMREQDKDIDQYAISLQAPVLAKFWDLSKRLTISPRFSLRVYRKGP